MKIEQLTIENFKCFKSEKTFDFSRLTILTGANSSGKSSVMYAILSTLQTENFPAYYSLNGDFVNLGDFKEIVFRHDTTKLIQLNLKIKDDGSKIIIKSKWSEDKKDLLAKRKSLYLEKNGKVLSSNEKEISYDDAYKKITPFTEYKNNVNYISAFRQSPKRTYLEKNKADFKIGTEGEEYIDQIVEWDKRSNGKIKELVKTMKDLDLIKEIKINRLGGGRFEVLVKPVSSNNFSALSDVGSGISAFMPIIVADLQLPNDSTLYLQEPETHLHPSIQSKFGGYIVDKINNSDKNYVIETHSEYFLNRIRLAIVKGELKKEDIKVYFLENNGEDTDVYDIDFRKNGGIRNAPPSFFETHSMDVMEIALNAFEE